MTKLILAVALASGCDLVLDNPQPEEARVTIGGEAGKPIRVITSSQFVAAVNEQGQTRVEIFVADTVITTLPYQHTYDISDDARFFIEAARLDEDLETIAVQVFLDGRKQFDEAGSLVTGQPYRFLYTFNQRITQDILVL